MKIFSQPVGDHQEPANNVIAVFLLIIICIGIGWKVVWLLQGVFPFNADEAITGLMARHIIQGARPVFFYGQSYMGSLDAFLVAGLFRLLGDGVFPIRILQIFLYTCTIITTAALGKSITNSWRVGCLAALFMAVPAVNVLLYTTVSLGGYGEALLISNCAFLCATTLFNRSYSGSNFGMLDWVLVGLLGLIGGLGFWVFGLTLIATIPAVMLILTTLRQTQKITDRSKFLAACLLIVFFILGSLPWWIESLRNGFVPLIKELSGSAVSVEGGNWLSRSATHLLYFIFLGLPAVLGLRPPWEVRWLVLPLIPFILIGWGLVFVFFIRSIKSTITQIRTKWYTLLGSIGLLTTGFVFTPFGLDPSGRYFLPLAVPFALILAWVMVSKIKKTRIMIIAILLFLVFHGTGTWQAAEKNPPGITTQFDSVSWIDHRYDAELISFLQANGELRGYSNYWVAYPLAFLSNEEIIFSPRLPYHADLRYTSRDDRYPLYTQLVQGSATTAYITTFNPALDKKIQEEFTRLDITWQEKTIGDYHIYFHLSRAVHPGEIGLGFDSMSVEEK